MKTLNDKDTMDGMVHLSRIMAKVSRIDMSAHIDPIKYAQAKPGPLKHKPQRLKVCTKGLHRMTPSNIYKSNGKRRCRKCRLKWEREFGLSYAERKKREVSC